MICCAEGENWSVPLVDTVTESGGELQLETVGMGEDLTLGQRDEMLAVLRHPRQPGLTDILMHSIQPTGLHPVGHTEPREKCKATFRRR